MDNWKIRQTVDLARGGASLRVWPDALMVEGDNEAHTWEITVMENGKPANLDGVTCLVHFLRVREGQDEDVVCKGSIAGNIASVVLKQECYVEGQAIGIFRIVVDEKTLTLSKLLFTISKGPTGVVIDPGSVVGDLESLLAQMDRMESGTAAANKAAAAADTAAQAANTAAANADSKASAANTAAQTANTAAANADSKASAANTAAQTANTAAANADSKASAANTAAQAANTAAANADSKASAANTAAQTANTAAANANSKADAANTAAQTANTAAANADSKASAANTAAQTANTAAANANSKADAANTAAQAANTAADRVDTSIESANAAAQAANTAAEQANEAAQKANELAGRVDDLADDVQRIDWKTGVKKYVVRWDKATAQCTRMGDAAGITTDITHFAHRGSVDPDYANPFDELYPWSHRKLCKVDRATYKAIFEAGGNIMDAVTMWEDEPGFALGSAVPGMDMVYTPTFWRTCWEDDSYVYAAVADGEVPGWEKRPATIGARYHASADADGNLTSQAGDIAKRFTAFSALHSNAKAQKMTLDDIFTWCDDTILMVVEFATMNTQNAVGQGVCSLYREDETGHPLEEAAASNTVILPTVYKSYCIPGAVLDIGTSKSSGNVATRVVESVEDYSDTSYCVVTFAGDPVDILTTHYCAIHGMSNTADAEIGSKSGYIGTNGRSIAYYRGRIAHGNYWRYVLGAYRQTGTGHIFVADSRADANAADALDTSKHTDTGCALPQGTDGASTEGYLKALHILTKHPLAPFGAETGGNSSNPVGDYLWVPALTTGNTILLAGAHAYNGALVGRFCGSWGNSAGSSWWGSAVLLFLISPEGD